MPVYGGGSEKCARCSKVVYLAEKKVGAGRSFHMQCFSCYSCNRKLDASILSEHKGEIYCKTCYTRQFGAHGLVSGVTMTTENPNQHVRISRRSSYGDELDPPSSAGQKPRPRAHSNDNLLHGEPNRNQNDDIPKLFPWRNDVLPDGSHSPTESQIPSVNNLVQKPSQTKTTNEIGFDRATQRSYSTETTTKDNRHSTLNQDDGRDRFIIPGENFQYGNGAFAIVDMPTAAPPKHIDSYIGKIDIPLIPTKSVERTPSPTDMYRRQTSRDPPIDIPDRFSRIPSNDQSSDTWNWQNSNAGVKTTILTENPLIKPTTSHSSTYESNFFAVTHDDAPSNEINRSRDSSPSTDAVHQRTSSSTSGYHSTSVHSDRVSRVSTSPSAAFVGQHDYINMTPTVPIDQITHRHSASPLNYDRGSSTLNVLATNTNPLNVDTRTNGANKFSALGALVQPMRPLGLKEYEQNFGE